MDWAQCFVHHPERKLQSIQLDRKIFVNFFIIVLSHKCTVEGSEKLSRVSGRDDLPYSF